ncbi:hypothetical protein JCGZ_00294 [Jatropha curcas]|uniref:mitogen-activated protein kinase kinase kinase n=1 Tax=Jatropha curcas TaxID=180498 RepID=A0A067L235_JATCU|nr:hypothetical protein JCGZ_00294 [Jatropha curcas]
MIAKMEFALSNLGIVICSIYFGWVLGRWGSSSLWESSGMMCFGLIIVWIIQSFGKLNTVQPNSNHYIVSAHQSSCIQDTTAIVQEGKQIQLQRTLTHQHSIQTHTLALNQQKTTKSRRPTIRHWQKGDHLGRGSFGLVYEGFSAEGFFFAVKEIKFSSEYSRTKVEEEIALLSQFNHQNIVQYYGTQKVDSVLYIFLELLSKGSLDKLYKKFPLQDSQVSAYTRQILHGLNYLHEQNVIHRDIKCANILINGNGSVKLADFGLARVIESGDLVKSFKGTPCWMAPEVVNPKRVGGYGVKADIWSLGCTVLEMLTREMPYSDMVAQPYFDPMNLILMIGEGALLPTIPNYLSADSRDFIQQCLKVNPEDRPTACQLLDHPFVKEV